MKLFYTNRIHKVVKVKENREQKKLLESIIENVIKKNVTNFEIQTKIAEETYKNNIPKNIWRKMLQDNLKKNNLRM